MRRFPGHAAVPLSFALLLASAPVMAQTADVPLATADQIVHLHGTVVNGITHRPVPYALVISMDQRLATMSDDEGRFHFEVSIPPRAQGTQQDPAGFVQGGLGIGAYAGSFIPSSGRSVVFQVRKPGFQEPHQFETIPLVDSASPITLTIVPNSAISGRVVLDGTERPTGVTVTLLAQDVEDGRYRWLQRNSRNIAGDGSFRFGDLVPGDYTVVAGPSQMRPSPLRPGRNGAANPAEDVSDAYAPVFAGDVPSLEGATVFHLRPGDTPAIELHPHPERFYQVTIPVNRTAAAATDSDGAGPRQPGSGIAARVLTQPPSLSLYRIAQNQRTGTVEAMLPDGQYTVLLNGFGPASGSALVPVHVAGGPVTTSTVTLVPGGKLAVRVHTDFTAEENPTAAVSPQGVYTSPPEPEPAVQLYLHSDSGSGVNAQHAAGTPVNELTISNLQPGTYRVQAFCRHGYVSSMTSGGVDLRRDPLTVSTDGTADPIDITLRDDSATLQGTVKANSTITASMRFTAAVPLSGEGDMFNGVVASDGSFTINNLPPGSYRVLVISNSRHLLPYRDPQAMHRYDGEGATVTLSSGTTSTVTVPELSDKAELP